MAKSRSQTRNAIRDELVNFNSFQDAQLNALNSIATALEKSAEISIKVSDNLTNINQMLNAVSSRFGLLDNEVDSSTKTFNKFKKSLSNDGEELSKVSHTLQRRFLELSRVVAETANRYSQLSNRMITVTGATGAEVRETRNEIVQGIVAQLNKETGGYFNPEKAYTSVIQMAESANVGSLEAIEEMARPLLLASESTNMNQTKLTALLNKWYTRYSFTSSDMESMVDEIRGNTAGNNASAEAALENINKLQSWMVQYSGGDAQKLDQWSASISKGSSWLESMGVDSSRYTEYIYKLLTGEARSDKWMMNLASTAGYSPVELENLAKSGDFENIYELLFNAEADVFKNNFSNTTLKKQYADIWGQDLESIVDASNARDHNDNYVSLKDFVESTEGAQTAAESIDDKFVTVIDRLKTITNSLSEIIAGIQENIGIGLSDIVSLMTVLVGAKVLGSGGSLLSGGLKSVGARGVGKVGSLLGRAGLNMGAHFTPTAIAAGAAGLAGVAGGAAGAYYGISTGLEDFKNGSEDLGMLEMMGGAATGVGAGVIGASMLGIGAANAWNPAGWAALLGGGVLLAGTALYKNAQVVEGNAEKVSQEIDNIGDSLKRENSNRKDQLSKLSYSFEHASTLEEKKALLAESGLFTQEELNTDSEEALSALITSYKSAAASMDEVTDGILKTADKYYGSKESTQQSEFINKLLDEMPTINGDRVQVFETLLRDTTDEKTREKLQKSLEDGFISAYEWKRALKGSIWTNNNLTEQSLPVSAMQDISGWLGWGETYEDVSANKESAIKLANSLMGAATSEAFNSILDQIKSSNLESDVEAIIGYSLSDYKRVKGYKVGSNYINANQLAYLHEGESVVPKQYNPAANVTELEMLRKYYKDSTTQESTENTSAMKELLSAIVEIRDFLKYWQEDNTRKDSLRTTSRYAQNSRLLAGYNTYNI